MSNTRLSESRAATWNAMKRTSVRSFGAAAASIGPDFIAEARAPPDLQKWEVSTVRCGIMRAQGVWHGLIQAFSMEYHLQDESDDAIDASHICTPHNTL